MLPVIQGFVGQRPFTMKIADPKSNSVVIDASSTPDDIQMQSWHEKQKNDAESDSDRHTDSPSETYNGKDFLLTLVSRRSVKRAGLRYLRRGADDEGSTANSVETEQILSSPTWNTSQDQIFSYTQFRGSIPLFFSQSPYSLKPQVTTSGTFESNARAFKRHFNDLSARWGDVYCDSLVDKHGTEATIGELYEKHAKALNADGGLDGKGKQLGFEWFDFHNVCRGMHFENVSKLMDILEPFSKATGWTEISDDQVKHKQSGILRTNCMDCLDRTNVVQSACARTALEAQLSAGSYTIDLQNDPSTTWFNTLWADNGDAISRQYAGTAALKGDFTRTRKRQITGALTDFGLTLTRYYTNIVNDPFTQALIDYLLGRAPESIFAELGTDMKTSDAAIASPTLDFSPSHAQILAPYLPSSTSKNASGPHISLSYTTSLDSALAPTPPSAADSKSLTTFLRSKHDAVLIDFGTHHPSLDSFVQARPVVLDPSGQWSFDHDSKVMELARQGKGKAPWVFTKKGLLKDNKALLESVGGREFVIPSSSSSSEEGVGEEQADSSGRTWEWNDIWIALADEGIRSVLVDGGSGVINDLLSRRKDVDTVIVTIAPVWLGQGGERVCPPARGNGVEVGRLRDVKWVPMGEDVVLCGRMGRGE